MNEPAAKTSDSRYYSLDLWRGVACLMVVVFHSAYYITENPGVMPGGVAGRIYRVINGLASGVPMFFVISGYCIAAACDALRARPRGVRQYFYRRFRRIFPPYWCALGVALGAMLLLMWIGRPDLLADNVVPLSDPLKLSPGRWTGNLMLIETWRSTIFEGGRHMFAGFFVVQAWTLCYEEQFYAVCGLALFLSPRWFFRSVCAITVAVAAVAFVHMLRPLPVDGFFFDGRWLTFAAGVLVYYRLRHATPRAAMAIDVGLVLITAAAIALLAKRPDKLLAEFRTGAAFAVLILLLYRWDRAIYSHRLLAPLRICGVMSYSIYLLHWPLVKLLSHLLYLAGLRGPWQTLFVTIPICLMGSVVTAYGFYQLVERRFLNLPSAKRPQPATAAASRSGGELAPVTTG